MAKTPFGMPLLQHQTLVDYIKEISVIQATKGGLTGYLTQGLAQIKVADELYAGTIPKLATVRH